MKVVERKRLSKHTRHRLSAIEGIVLAPTGASEADLAKAERIPLWEPGRIVRRMMKASRHLRLDTPNGEYERPKNGHGKRKKNGSQFPMSRTSVIVPSNIDGRSFRARRYKDAGQAFIADLGGSDVVTAQETELIRTLAVVCVIMDELAQRILTTERNLSNPRPFETSLMGSFQTMGGFQMRLANCLNLGRRPKDRNVQIDQSLSEYLSDTYGAEK